MKLFPGNVFQSFPFSCQLLIYLDRCFGHTFMGLFTAAGKNKVFSFCQTLMPVSAIKAETEALTQVFYKVSEKLYQQAAPQGDPNCAGDCNNCGDNGNQNYYDADYTVVDDDNK